MRRRIVSLLVVAPFVLFLAACPMANMSHTSQPGSSPAGGTQEATPTIQTDTTRNQGVLVTPSGAKLDIASVADDGTTVNCVAPVSIAPISDPSNAKSLSTNYTSIIVGTRGDGNPGAWVYSSGKIQGVIDEDSGQLTSRLPDTTEQNGAFRGQFGWVYYVQGVSADGKVIVGYALNKKGINFGTIQIDPGTTIGVYWRVTRHPVRPFFLVSHAHIIGTLDQSKINQTNKWLRRLISEILEHSLGQLNLLLVNYLNSYLIMVDKNGVTFDATDNLYLVTGTDQNDQPATASISQQGNITITETTTNTGPTVYAAGFYNNGTSSTACYWKNGTRFDLGGTGISTGFPAVATSISAANGNVYVGGYYNNSGAGYVGCYWVIDASGVVTKTDLPGANANVNGIFVSGGTVYTAGYYNNGAQNIACYWTGTGNPVSLPSAGISFATSLYVTGSTIYVAGQDNFSTACYWTIAGTTATPVQTALTSMGAAIANSISGSGSAISIAGQDTPTSGIPTAVYWTGSSLGEIDLKLANGSANSIFVSSTAIYIAGQYVSANPVAFYWNGAETDLPGPASAPASNAQSVYVSGTTAYVAGYYGSPATASYWTIAGSTVSQALNLSAANSGQANAIIVQ